MKRSMRILRLFWIGLAACMVFPGLTSWVAAAENDDADYQEYTLGEIVVREKASTVRDIAISNEITPDDFEAVNAESVADALMYVPGVQVVYSPKGAANFSIHGFDQNRILTLIDGVPYYETKYGGMDLNQIGLASVARIDVIKGAPSVLYGPNALGGAVNIITKKATETPHLSATVEYGLDGIEDAYKASVSHGMKRGMLNYWLSYSRREWDSWDLSDDFDPRVGQIRRRPGGTQDAIIEDGGERLNSDYQSDSLWAKVGIEPSAATEVYLNFHYITTEKGASPNIDTVNVFTDFSQFARITAYDDWGVDLSAEHAFNDRFNLQTKVYYHDHEDEYTSYSDQTYADAIALSTYKDSIIGGMLLGDYKLADWNTLRSSLHYKKDVHEQRDIESLPFAKSAAYTGSIGLENESTLLAGKLSVVPGISYDWFDVTEAEEDPENDGNLVHPGTPKTTDEFNPMIGTTYLLTDSVQLFGSVAKKTRFPTLSQLYSGDLPNLDLKAETAINYTVGAAWTWDDVLKLSVAPFFHDISDYITRDVPPSVNPFSQYLNYEEVEMKGVETEASITPIRDLLLKLGFMANQASNKSSGRITDDVPDVPEYTFNFGIQYILPGIRTRLNWTTLYIGESYGQLPTPEDPDLEVIKNDDYLLYNARVSQPFWHEHLEVFLSAENLLDEDYEPIRSLPAPGRRIWLGLTYNM